MANQGTRENQTDKTNREREGNLGQSGNHMNRPTGTSGRPGDNPRRPKTEDEDSPLGNRNTNR